MDFEPQLIDYLFFGFIALVVIGGIVSLMVLLPKEHALEERTRDCYRIVYRDGNYSISHKKPRISENSLSFRSKFFYIKKAPFTAEAFCDGAEAKDGKKYRATCTTTMYFPEDKLNVFAPTFHGANQDGIVETMEESLTNLLTERMADYDGGDPEKFAEAFKEEAQKTLDVFGLFVMSVKNMRITENK